MTIWITGTKGYLTGFSLTEQAGWKKVELDVTLENFDFVNWRWTGQRLLYDPDNVPVVENELTEIEQLQQENTELKSRIEQVESSILEVADLMLGGE